MEELANELLFKFFTHYNSQVHKLNDFIENFKLNINHRNENGNGRTALHYAIESCGFTLVEKILFYGADPNIKDDSGNTALHYAAKSGYEEDIMILLKNNANINLTNNIGETPLFCSVIYRKNAITKLLLDYNADICISNIYGTSVIELVGNTLGFENLYIQMLKLLWNLKK